MTTRDELALIERARAGDQDAFESIVRAYEKILYNLALRTLRSREDAADAVQETFLKAFRALPEFRAESKLSVWLYKIANNVCMDMLRSRKETGSLTEEDGAEDEASLADGRFDPVTILERKDLRDRVHAALRKLPLEFRQPLLLRAFGELSYAEIAATLSLDQGTVKSRIYRARKGLCAILSEDGNFSDENPSKRSEGGAKR